MEIFIEKMYCEKGIFVGKNGVEVMQEHPWCRGLSCTIGFITEGYPTQLLYLHIVVDFSCGSLFVSLQICRCRRWICNSMWIVVAAGYRSWLQVINNRSRSHGKVDLQLATDRSYNSLDLLKVALRI